jgi:FkbM family methyltransferase
VAYAHPASRLLTLRLVARSILSNPGNRGHRLERIARGVCWQIWKRSIRQSRRIRLANGLFFHAHPDCVVSSALHYADWPEYHELQWLRRVLGLGDVILDVGANVGHISLLLADVVGSDALFAFEPAPIAFARLSENWRLNGWDTGQLIQAAVGASTGTAHIPFASTPLTTLSLVDRTADGARPVPLMTLDSSRCLWERRRIGLLKIDVEGHEAEVLNGAAAVLSIDRPKVVMFESLGGRVQADVERCLSTAGYRVFQLDGSGRPDHSRTDAQNLFASPEELPPNNSSA